MNNIILQLCKIPGDSVSFVREIIGKKYLIYELVKRDFTQRFVGSWLGIFWAFVEPLVMVLVFWLVFGGVFRGKGEVDSVPYILWLLPALISWNYFSDVFSSGTGSIRAFSFLVKKVDFKLSILPIVKICSSLILHAIFLLIAVCFLFAYGSFPTFYWFQMLYYLLAMTLFLLGLTWMTSSISLFVKDVQNIVGIILRVGFYGTPVFWNIEIVPVKYQFLFKLNPLFYIVEGYRNSFVYGKGFWHEPLQTAYFWGVTFLCIAGGVFVYRKLRPHFADVV